MVFRKLRIDRTIIGLYFLLSIIGLIMIYSSSASFPQGSSSFAIRQGIFIFIGLIVMFLASRINLKIIFSTGFLQVAIIGLILALLVTRFIIPAAPGTGAHGWIFVGPISIQPAEFAKLGLILYYANSLYNQYGSSKVGTIDLNQLVANNWAPFLSLILILIMPDFGNFMITVAILLIMYLSLRGVTLGSIVFVLIGIGYLILPRVVSFLPAGHSNYQLMRFITFINPWNYLETGGAQLVQSYYAIARGGLFGAGIGNSLAKTGYLPEANTDFIMSVISEELGVLGVVIIIILESWLIYRIIRIGRASYNVVYRVAAYGVAAFLFLQIIINFGGISGALPITGVVFPFISYGGSSFLVLSLAIGLVLNIADDNIKHASRRKS